MLLLADAISEFTNSSLNVMDFAWDIIWMHQLNITKVDFELIWDAHIYSLTKEERQNFAYFQKI